jgi:hypothetical protein
MIGPLLLIPDTIRGLPTHALIVHFVVVLLPLAAVSFIATGWKADWRRHYALPVMLMALAAAVAAYIATESGQALEDQIKEAARAAGTRARLGDHPDDGELARNVSFVFALVSVGFWAVVMWAEKLKLPSWAPMAVYAIGTVVGLFAIFAVISAGESGATLVWKDLGNFVKPA